MINSENYRHNRDLNQLLLQVQLAVLKVPSHFINIVVWARHFHFINLKVILNCLAWEVENLDG